VDGIHGQVHDYPLKDYGDLADYKFPPLPKQEDLERLKMWVKETKDKGYFVIVGFNPGNYFERMQWLRGFVNLMRGFSKRTRGVYRLAGLLLEYCLQAIGKGGSKHRRAVGERGSRLRDLLHLRQIRLVEPLPMRCEMGEE